MYSKLFGSIVNSSIWSEDSDVRVMWVTMMAMADSRGYVFGSVSGLARITSIPLKKVQDTIGKFLAPDPLSSDATRAPERKGRRIEVIDGGWRLLNYEHYRDLKDAENRREQVKEAVRRYRKKAKDVIKCNPPISDVTNVIRRNPSESDSYSDSDSDSKKKRDALPGGPKDGPAWGLCRYFKHCKMPTGPTKKSAFEELIRQGVSYEDIRDSGENPERQDWDFFDHIKVLKPPSKVASSKPILKTPF